ncbi:uncharacterized protein [Elaeis guineensis]|uniref:Uncharacterized protein LOC105041354 isoform X1 n=1 Tax=Elaeis guineensis var. tenera TaxID=51953 RepID=A0A6I9QYL3_ELAGV|nr:uncharacterized protein LOC105041354 isoform X1 [Elaeis guineensis]
MKGPWRSFFPLNSPFFRGEKTYPESVGKANHGLRRERWKNQMNTRKSQALVRNGMVVLVEAREVVLEGVHMVVVAPVDHVHWLISGRMTIVLFLHVDPAVEAKHEYIFVVHFSLVGTDFLLFCIKTQCV